VPTSAYMAAINDKARWCGLRKSLIYMVAGARFQTSESARSRFESNSVNAQDYESGRGNRYQYKRARQFELRPSDSQAEKPGCSSFLVEHLS